MYLCCDNSYQNYWQTSLKRHPHSASENTLPSDFVVNRCFQQVIISRIPVKRGEKGLIEKIKDIEALAAGPAPTITTIISGTIQTDGPLTESDEKRLMRIQTQENA